MEPRTAVPQVQAEYEALNAIDEKILEFRNSAQTFLEIQQDINDLFDLPSTVPDPPGPREHLFAYGCGWDGGYCQQDHLIRCIDDIDCEETETGPCELPKGVCSENRIRNCFDDGDCPDMGTCMTEDIEPPLKSELRGPFAIEEDQLKILSEFMTIRTLQEESREYRKDLKKPDEFATEETEEIEQSANEEANPLHRLMRDVVRGTVRTWNQLQGREEAATFPITTDPQLEMVHALDPLTKAVSRLARLARNRDGLRSFVLRYDYFLRRTCIYRPCNLILEQILRIAMTEECFPYTNGEFLSDSPGSPRWRKCLQSMGNQ